MGARVVRQDQGVDRVGLLAAGAVAVAVVVVGSGEGGNREGKAAAGVQARHQEAAELAGSWMGKRSALERARNGQRCR